MRRLGSHNWLWAIIVAGIICVLTITTRVTGPEFPVNTDVVSLMPEEKRDPLLAHAFDTSAKMLSSRIAFLIETNDSELADQAAFTLEQMLVDSRIFRPSAEEARELFDWLHDNRTELLCPRDRILLASGQGQSLEQSALGMIFAPLVPIPGEIIQSDPLLLSFRLIDCLSLSGNVPDNTRLVAGQLTTSPFAFETQEAIADTIARFNEEFEGEGFELLRAGAVFHAAAVAEQARFEITWISIVAGLVVMTLLTSLFSSLRAAFLALFSIAYGALGGLAVSLVAFETIHALALVLGAALAGVAVDYAIHVMAGQLERRSFHSASEKSVSPLLRPLLISMLTTITAFACIAITGVELLAQVALFGAAGLVFSFSFSWIVVRRYWSPPETPSTMANAVALIATRLIGWRPSPAAALGAVAIFGLIIAVASQKMVVSDDVRTFRSTPAELLAEERSVIEAYAGKGLDTRFILMRASALEALRHTEGKVTNALSQPVPAPAWIDPSKEIRSQNRDLLEQELFNNPQSKLAETLGIDAGSAYQTDKKDQTLPALIEPLRGTFDSQYFSIVPISKAEPEDRLKAVETDRVDIVDPADTYSDLVSLFREQATLALGLALLVAAISTALFYRDIASLWIVAPPALAVGLTGVVLAVFGEAMTLFTIMGLFMVLGTSIDFAVFQREDRVEGLPWRKVGILVAGLTTTIPMTILAWSETLPIRHFGLAVAIGIIIGIALSPLARTQFPKRAR